MSKVIIGEGKPRLVIQSVVIITSTVVNINPELKIVYLSGSTILTDDILNRFLICKNYKNEDTKGKIVEYSNTGNMIYIDKFTNGFPVNGSSATIKDRAIDLPYSKEMVHQFEPLFLQPKIRYYDKKKIRKLLGFYYYVTVDYSNYSKRNMLESLGEIYDSTRNLSFYFFPHVDNLNVSFECEINPDEYFAIAQHIKNQGHKYVKLSFEGLTLLTKIPLDSSLGLINYDILVEDEMLVY